MRNQGDESVNLPLCIVPDVIEGTFIEIWGKLRGVEKGFVPYVPVAQAGPGIPSDVRSDVNLSMESPDANLILDTLAWKQSDGSRVGLVYTDVRLVDKQMVSLAAPMNMILERFFHSPRHLVGAVFNSGAEEKGATAYMVQRLSIARILGFIISNAGSQEVGYSSRAAQAVSADRIYEAFHFACLARETSEAMDEFFFPELECLMTFAAYKEAGEYLQWYAAKGGRHPRVDIMTARYCTLQGAPAESLKILDGKEFPSDFASQEYLERGRAIFRMGQPSEALRCFEKSLEKDDRNCDAWMGQGISLRALHYDEANKPGLEKALASFQAVIDYDGYHSSEALHHSGTILAALDRWDEAEAAYRRTLDKRFSAVSYRNLFLALVKRREPEEGRAIYKMLKSVCPEEAEGLERYLTPAESAQAISVPRPTRSPLQLQEEANKTALAAGTALKEWGIQITGSLSDFRGIDDFISFYAPSGEFMEQSAFGGLSEEDVGRVVIIIAQHLSGILVRRGYAAWSIEDENALGFAVRFKNHATYKDPVDLYSMVYHRLLAGAVADSLVSLDFFASSLPDYKKAMISYKNPYERHHASEGEVRAFGKEVLWAEGVLNAFGIVLTDSIRDLEIYDGFIDKYLDPDGQEEDHAALEHVIGEETFRLINALGLKLGFLYQTCTGGVWYNHPILRGLLLQSDMLVPFAPVEVMYRRVINAGKANEFTSLKAYTSPFLCASLALQVREKVLRTRDEIAELLKEGLPSVMKEDPTGASLSRMVEMVVAQAAVRV